MNIVQLEYVTKLVQLGSYTAAAKSLCKTTQAVSKAICDLERELQTDLFMRKNGRIVPTQFGELLAIKAEEILDSFTDVATFAKNPAYYPRNTKEPDWKEDRSIIVALADTTLRGFPLSNLFPKESLAPFTEGKMQLICNPSGSCLAALEEGTVDAAIVLGRVQKPGLRCVKLFTVTPTLLLSSKHPLAKEDIVSVSHLRSYPIALPMDLRYCYRAITRFIEAYGCSPKYENLAPLVTEHQAFLNNHKGVVFVLEDENLIKLYGDVVFKQLQGNNRLQIPICFVTKEDQLNPDINLLELALTKTAALSTKGLQ